MSFPTYDDAVDVAQLQAAVAEMLNQRVKSGSTSTPVSGLTPGGVAGPFYVSFPNPFASAPRVTISAANVSGGTNYLVPRMSGATASGFNAYVYNVGPVAATGPLTVTWIATDLGNA